MRNFVINLLLCFVCSSAFAQVDEKKIIKKIIYNDLYTLNDVYDGCLIQFQQEKHVYKGNETIKYKQTMESLRDSSDSRVIITEIDTNGSYLSVEVRFNLISGLTPINLLSSTFNYVLYQSKGKYYKVNGFFISDILLINDTAKRIKKGAKVKAPNCIFAKHLKNRNSSKISKYLSVSVIQKVNSFGFKFFDKPYVKDVVYNFGI